MDKTKIDSTQAIKEALEKVHTILTKTHDITKQHNLMLLDLYERVAKLEGAE